MTYLNKYNKYTKKYNILNNQIGGTNADQENIFLLNGHGCTIVDEIYDVPPNCIYVTYAECGNEIDAFLPKVIQFINDFNNKKAVAPFVKVWTGR
jgi:hypothetical protein